VESGGGGWWSGLLGTLPEAQKNAQPALHPTHHRIPVPA
jgi:hypothetical protein